MDALQDIIRYVTQHMDILVTLLATVAGLRLIPDKYVKYLLKTQKAIDAIDEVGDKLREELKARKDSDQ